MFVPKLAVRLPFNLLPPNLAKRNAPMKGKCNLFIPEVTKRLYISLKLTDITFELLKIKLASVMKILTSSTV